MRDATGPWWLYRWYDEQGLLLYIGITNDLERRRDDHLRRSWWAAWAVVVDADRILGPMSKREATLAEIRAVEDEGPIFNRNLTPHGRERVLSYFVDRGIDAAEFLDHLPDQGAPKDSRPIRATARRTRPVENHERVRPLAGGKRRGRQPSIPRKPVTTFLVSRFEIDSDEGLQLYGVDNHGEAVHRVTRPDGSGRLVRLSNDFGLYDWPEQITVDYGTSPYTGLNDLT